MKKHLFASAMICLGLYASAQSQRMALYEEFTGETCPPCAATNPGLNALLQLPVNQSKVIAIKWQVPIPSAPTKTWSLYQTNKAEIDWRWKAAGYGYGINSAPSGKMDGQNVQVFGASSSHPANLTSAAIANAAAVPSAFDMKIDRRWKSDLSAVDVTITIAATAAFSSVGNLMLRTVMVERLITFSVQPGTNGEKVFEDAVIRSFPTVMSGTNVIGMGTALPSTWAVGDKQVITMSCAVPSYTRKLEEIAIVGFIQDDGDKKIHQAYRAEPVGTKPNDAQILSLQTPVTICTNTFESVVTIRNNGSTDITSMDITPSLDGVAGSKTMWTGVFPSGSSITVTLNALSSGVAGGHNVSVDISNVSGGDNNTVDNTGTSQVYLGVGTTGKTVVQDFEVSAFPPALWATANPDKGTATWSQATGATVGGYASSATALKYNFYGNTKIGDIDEIYLPPTNLYGTAEPELVFEYSYVKNSAPNADKLEVMASADCGDSWSTFYSASGMGLVTTQTLISGAFTPNASEHWSFQNVKLTGMNLKDVLVKFVVTNGNGNNLYLDNINLFQSQPTEPPVPNPVGISENANLFSAGLYPNPTSGNVSVKINSPVSGNAVITVVNTLGQVLAVKNTVLNGGSNVIEMNVSELPAGLYSVNVESNNGSVSKKLTVNK